MSDVPPLLAALDDPWNGAAEEAQAQLTALGAAAMPAVVDALPRLSRLGKLCAIEMIEELEYAAAGPALVALLRDPEDTVREWAAAALGRLGYRPAVPELVALAARLRSEQAPVDWTEPVAVRRALTALGDRHPVVPPLLAATVERRSTGRVWPAARLEELVEALAEAGQVVLYFQVARRHDRWGLVWEDHDRSGWQFETSVAWQENVRASREAALLEAAVLPPDRSERVVSIEWIDATDVAGTRPNPGPSAVTCDRDVTALEDPRSRPTMLVVGADVQTRAWT